MTDNICQLGRNSISRHNELQRIYNELARYYDTHDDPEDYIYQALSLLQDAIARKKEAAE